VALQGYLPHDLAAANLDLETRAHLEALQAEVRRTLETKNMTSQKS
jgi:hypothetical protein